MGLNLFNSKVRDSIDRIMDSAERTRKQIKTFVGNGQYTVISLGQNCNTGWYLKELNLKKESYPFDWIFTSADIVEYCIKDDFVLFLDKQYIETINDKSAGHKVYHKNLFNHKNPLNSIADYQYYERCVSRFKKMMLSNNEIIFVCTLVNEPAKRPGWSKGFVYENYSLPLNQSHQTYNKLINLIKAYHSKVKFIFIEQYTEDEVNIKTELINDHVMNIVFTSQGKNTGVKYINKLDDRIIKIIYSGLCMNNEEIVEK